MNSPALSRRSFVAAAATVAAAGSSAGAVLAQSPDASEAPISGVVPFRFDRAAFAERLNRPQPHRQLAATVPWSAATVAIAHFKNTLAAYADPNGFAAGPNSVHCAVVLFGGRSMLMALNDAMFAKYPLGLMADEEMRPNDLSLRAYWTGLKKNPILAFEKATFDAGVSLFVCNNSFSGLAVELAQRATPQGSRATREQVIAIHNELSSNFIDGAMLVPAGVAAINAAQEARFTFLPA